MAAACLACQAVVHEAAQWASNGTAVTRAISGLQQDCDKLFPHENATAAACRGLAKDAVNLLPFIEKQLDTLAWDERALCAALGACEVPCCTSNVPQGVHLSLRPVPEEMAVMWTTLDASAGQAAVIWGVSPSALTSSAAELAPQTYTDFGWRGLLHTAILKGLAPNQTYYYQVGAAATQSQVFSFRTLSSGAGSAEAPLRIISLGDMGYGPKSDATVADLTRQARGGP